MKILMVDDHALFRAGLQLILKALASKHKLEFVEASTASEAIKLSDEAFDLILLDLIMPGTSGRQAFDAVLEAFTGTRIVILSGEDSPQLVRATIEAGASGYILKQTPSAVFTSALELILAGGVYLPPSILRYFDAAGEIHDTELRAQQSAQSRESGSKQTGELTKRQLDVLKAVVRGGSNKSIAKELNVSEGTVKAHLSSAYRVLGVRTRTQAVMAVASSGYPETKE